MISKKSNNKIISTTSAHGINGRSRQSNFTATSAKQTTAVDKLPQKSCYLRGNITKLN